MFTLRMRRRRRLLDTYMRVEREEHQAQAEERPPGSRETAPRGRWGAPHVEPEGITQPATERMPRESRGAAT